ncbi:ribonuclease H-like domain-containing protein [Mycena capillaripes]|nr:ribonuclease H-like domain-containing protein [Mycena capillaripes]
MTDTPVSVITNSFLIKSLPTRTYYQYDIFTPTDPKPPKRQRLIHTLQTAAPYAQVFTPRAVYDGNRLLYSSKAIDNGVYRVHGSNQNAPPDAPGWYDIKITRTIGEPIVPANLNQLMTKGQATPQTATAMNLLQLLLSQAKNQASPNTGRAYFVPEGKQPLRGMAVELWRGFNQAVRPSIGRMLVTVDTTVAAMYMPGPLIEVAMAVLDVRDIRRLALRDSNHQDFKKVERHLKNRLILVKTRDGPPRTKTVRELVPGPVGRYEFHPSGSGPKTTVGEHYQKTYQLTLAYPDTFGVVTSGKGAPFKVVIPLELCTMLPGQLYKKKLPPDATAAVVGFAAIPPANRLRTITSGAGGEQRSPVQDFIRSEFMVDAGMQVEQTPITLTKARLLAVPPLLYGNQKQVNPRDGAWNVLGSRLHTTKEMLDWGIINFDPHRIQEGLVHKTANGIVDSCTQLGMNVNMPAAMQKANGLDVKRAIMNICKDLGGEKNVKMLVFLLPAKADEIRTRIKFLCDVELGIRSQCLREPKLQRANNQYFNNVALKINARLGGANALVRTPLMEKMTTQPLMFIGADVAHPAPGANRPSVASLVWSHDRYGAAYCATTRVQLPRTEIITDLKEMTKTAILMFVNQHKTAPFNIFFFRDGVSEGEFANVKETEIKAVKDAFDELWVQYGVKQDKPRLTFVVVGKRHHVSFFPTNDRVGDKTGNCRAGLAVDAELANPQFPDFYLQSHAAIKGTSRSAHYTVLQDEVFGGNLRQLQELAFALCHIYAKATRSVSIPAPVYYADLACARGKFHFDPQSNMDFEGSTTSGGQSDFNLDPWTTNFKATHNNVKGSMFFL